MKDSISRRTFLQKLFSRLLYTAPVAALSTIVWHFLALPFNIRLEQKIFPGLLSDQPQGVQMMREYGIALIRRDDDLQAVGLTCTHLGCTVNRSIGGFVCPCHGSRFDSAGKVQKGPAARSLARYPVQITSDRHMIVDLGQPSGSEKG